MNPWSGIESMVTRRNPDQNELEALWSNQAISLASALNIYTIRGAEALRLESITGTIEVGKSADFIVLDQNLFEIEPTEINQTKVEMTFFNGKLVHSIDH
ncbi:MAG: amidohydrolase family protein [Kangiellaceae bacterium]|nr:amidohydrolase family protein [Kangiellaceae bacterium]